MEMLKAIDKVAEFSVKNGPSFEDKVRKEQRAAPQFAFLFGGPPNSEAAKGAAYFAWKKEQLLVRLTSQPRADDAQAKDEPATDKPASPGANAAVSPAHSDIDMEGKRLRCQGISYVG